MGGSRLGGRVRYVLAVSGWTGPEVEVEVEVEVGIRSESLTMTKHC